MDGVSLVTGDLDLNVVQAIGKTFLHSCEVKFLLWAAVDPQPLKLSFLSQPGRLTSHNLLLPLDI